MGTQIRLECRATKRVPGKNSQFCPNNPAGKWVSTSHTSSISDNFSTTEIDVFFFSFFFYSL